jgi:hypothetical protein
VARSAGSGACSTLAWQRLRPPVLATYRAWSARLTSSASVSLVFRAATPIEQVPSGWAVRSRSAIAMAFARPQSGSSRANSSPP